MSCKQPRRTPIEFLAAAIAVMGLSLAAHAAEMYRWNDTDGRTYYGDKPPRGAVNVTRIDVDVPASTVPSSRPVPAPIAPGPPTAIRGEVAPPPPDLLTQRRATRARLEEDLAKARAKLDLARKNLAEATDMAPEEQQSVVEKVADVPAPANAAPNSTIEPANMQVTGGGMYGMTVKRSNCSTVVGPSGKAGIICPTIIPNNAYRERIAALEDAVRKAEQDVEAAQTAYRRGVD